MTVPRKSLSFYEPEWQGFRMCLLTAIDEEGDGDLHLYCPDGKHFGVAFQVTGTFRVRTNDEDLWFVDADLAYQMDHAAGRLDNLKDLVRALRGKWEQGHARN